MLCHHILQTDGIFAVNSAGVVTLARSLDADLSTMHTITIIVEVSTVMPYLHNRPFLHKDFGCPEACLMAAPSGCSVFQLYLNSRK